MWGRYSLEPMTNASQVKATSTAGIEKSTGIVWDEWVRLLDAAGAATLTHAEIAELSQRNMPEHVTNSGWWAQGVAVAYEHHKGLRVPGQASDGKFSASVSKTFPGDKDVAIARWMEVVAGAQEFGEVAVEEDPTTSSTENWRYWRAKLADGTRIAVTVSDKPGGKSTVAVQHSKLDSEEQIGRWKHVWKDVLAQL